jgi:hypothetical protein
MHPPGFRFALRIRDLADKLYVPGDAKINPALVNCIRLFSERQPQSETDSGSLG